MNPIAIVIHIQLGFFLLVICMGVYKDFIKIPEEQMQPVVKVLFTCYVVPSIGSSGYSNHDKLICEDTNGTVIHRSKNSKR